MSDFTEALDRILNCSQRQRREYPQATEQWWIRLSEEEMLLAEIAEDSRLG